MGPTEIALALLYQVQEQQILPEWPKPFMVEELAGTCFIVEQPCLDIIISDIDEPKGVVRKHVVN